MGMKSIKTPEISRRQALAAIGTTLTAGPVYSSDQPAPIEIAQTKEIGDLGERKHSNRKYAIERMEEYIDDTLNQFLSNRNLEELEIVHTRHEPRIHQKDSNKALRNWRKTSNSDSDSHLLLTSKDFKNNIVGRGELPDYHGDNSTAVLGEAYKLLELEEEKEVPENILVSKYLGKDKGRVPHARPHTTALSGIHEVGHNLGLEHEHGEIQTEGTPLYRDIYTSIMAGSYTQETAEKQGIDLHYSDDIYWTKQFSDKAAEKLEKLY